MIVFAVVFFVYALNHPEGFIQVPIIGAKGLYIIYIIVVSIMLITSRFLKRKN
jgi:hypothetical protein